MDSNPDWSSSGECDDPAFGLPDRRDTGFFQILNSIRLSIFSIDGSGVLTHVMGSGTEIIGFDQQAVGRSIFTLPNIPNEVHQAIEKALDGEDTRLSINHYSERFMVEFSQRFGERDEADGVVGVISGVQKGKKIDTKKHLRAKGIDPDNLSVLEQEAVVGRLAGSAAHDLKNLLTSIAGSVELACLDAGEHMPFLDSALKRAIALVDSMSRLTFDHSSDIHEIDLKPIFRGSIMDALSGYANTKHIELTRDVQENLWPTMASMVSIERVLANLIMNAIDSIGNNGVIHASASNEIISQDDIDTDNQCGPRRYICIEIRDNGKGISKEHLDSIFKRGFSLKPSSKGLGVGLSNVAMIAEQLDGYVNVKSEEGKGTSFFVYLPACEEKDEDIS